MSSNKKIIFIAILLSIICFLGVFLILKLNEIKYLKNEINFSKVESEKSLNNANKKIDDLLKISKEIQKKNDSIKGKSTNEYKFIDGIRIGNQSISLEQLISIANRNMKDNQILRNKIYNDSITLKNHKEVLRKLEENRLIKSNMNDKMQGNLTYFNLEKYEDAINKFDSIINIKNIELNKSRFEIQTKNSVLNLIKKNYELDYKIEERKTDFTVKLLNTSKLDSALWVYPYYKHKIKTNKKGETIIK